MQTDNFELEPIAIIGIGCRFPNADNPDEFWDILEKGENAIKEIPDDRWDKNLFYSSEVGQKGKMNTISGGFLDRVDLFDAAFFGISDNEAVSMDPQQRLLMEVVYEAIEDSANSPEKLRGEKVGVFVGISSKEYAHIYMRNPEHIDMYSVSGTAGSVASNRISYVFDFKGPSISIDTACSSSLVAVHMACQSLRLRESNVAVAGGVNIILSPLITIGFSQAQATSPDGVCRAFDADANGMVRGEGCGIVILKPLKQAIKDNDNIYALIRGSAVNQDGQTNGLLAPSSIGQSEVLENAYANSGISPKDVNYIEAHGTGTPLGDPIETKALGQVLNIDRNVLCKIGSVKTNIGHLESAAGIAGLIKTVLCLKNKTLVPSLNYKKPNPYIPFEELGLSVQTELEKLDNEKIIAGVSSFGFGGTNTHVVLESYNSQKTESKSEIQNNRPFILPVSAHNEESLKTGIENYHQFLEKNEVSIWDLCYTASLKRQFHNFRTSLVFNSKSELISLLDNFDDEQIFTVAKRKPKLCFVFSGMGSQQAGMGKELVNEPVFFQVIKQCDELMKKYHDWSIIDEIKNENEQKIERVQPTLFAIQIGIVELFKSFGIKPDTLIGSSVGEVAAAYVSGILNLEDAIKVICLRNVSMVKMIGKGAMAIVQLSETETQEYIKDSNNVWVSALNSLTMTVLSGQEEELEKVISNIKEKNIFCRLIKGAVAPSHSPLMSPIKDEIIENLKDITPQKGNINIYSSVTGKKENGEIFNNNYWWNNIESPINFYPTINEIEKSAKHVYIEISPHPVLNAFIKESLTEVSDKQTNKKIFTLPSLKKNTPYQFYQTLGDIFSLGFKVNWENIYNDGNIISLPNYPWNKEQYWLDLPEKDDHTIAPKINIKEVESSKNKTQKFVLNRKTLEETQPENRKEVLNNYLKQHVAKVLKMPVGEVDINQPLKNLGIGSLMGMELFNRLKSDLEISLPVSKFLKGPSIEEISLEIINNLDVKTENIEIKEKKQNIPLSFAQQRLWFIEKFEKDVFAYNIPAGLKVHGDLKTDVLEKALNQIVKRHEILRTNFKTVNGQPIQFIQDEKFVPVRFIDLSDKENNLDICNQLILQDSSERFNLEKDNLLRVSTYKLGNKEFIVLLTIHHIIADGLSLKVIFNELSKIYEALSKNENFDLKPLKIQYSDYSLWQYEQFEKNTFEKQINYWKNKLSDIPSLLKLPLDKVRPDNQTYNGAMENFLIPEHLYKQLEELSKTQGVTLFTILLSAFKLLLSRYSGQNDIIIGTPIAGRNEPELEEMVGIFLNMLAIRDNVNFENNFSEFLQQVSNTALEAYDNQDIPFEKIVEIVKPERSMSHTPIFQVIMALHASIDIESFSNINIQSIDVDMKTSKFDLALLFIPDTQGFKGTFEYNTDLFNKDTIDRLKENYLTILNIIVKNIDIKLKDIDIISQTEKELIQQITTGTITQIKENSVLDLINSQVINSSESVAVSDNNQSLTYKELNEKSNIIANKLVQSGNKNIVAIMLEKSVVFIVAVLGVLKSGVAYLPIDINYPQDRNLFILNNSECKNVISSENLRESIPLDFKVLLIEDLKDGNSDNPEVNINSDDNAYLIYTSGTTGQPKGVQISHLNLLNLVKWHQRVYQISTKDKSALIASVAFDASVWEVFPNLASGVTLHIPDKNILDSTKKLMDWLNEKEITISFFPTPILELLLDKDWSSNSHLKTVLTGGDKLNKLPKENIPFSLHNHYGPTECSVVSTFVGLSEQYEEILLTHFEKGRTNEELESKNVGNGLSTERVSDRSSSKAEMFNIPIGKPIDNFKVLILDENLNICPIGVIGELYIGGLGLSKGYYNNPELTNEKFISIEEKLTPSPSLEKEWDKEIPLSPFEKGRINEESEPRNVGNGLSTERVLDRSSSSAIKGEFYKTGDLGKYRSDGNIEFFGRKDNQVKIRGVRIELAEIEQTIKSYKGVVNAFVTVIEHNNDKKIVAYVVGDNEKNLSEHLKRKLPDAMLPQVIYLDFDNLPLTPNGKVDFKKLPVPENNITLIEKKKDSDSIEEELKEIWQKILKKENIELNANFFELGGHSLIAIELVDNIIEEYQIEISLKELFNYPTINQIANLIKEKQIANPESYALAKIIHDEKNINQPFPLTDVQQAYWIGRGNNFKMGNISAHAYLELDIKNLNLINFEKALNVLIQRHPMLRTIILDNGTQQILDINYQYKVKTYDFKNENSENKLQELREKFSHEILDSKKFPLFNISVSLIDETISRIHISIDGLIADALSMMILAKELSELYINPQIALPELKINFRDYILAENKLHSSAIYQKSKDYWLNRLENLPLAPQLPTTDIEMNGSPKFNRLSYTLKADKWYILKQKSAKLNVSKSVLLLTIFSKVLAVWSKNKDFVINLTLFNRLSLHPQVKQIIGDFTSLNLLEVNNSSNESFEQACLKIQERLWQDIDNKHVGGIWVLRELAKINGLENALMPVVFTSLLAEEDNYNNPLLDNVVYSITQTPQVWLDHQVTESKGDLVFNWDYLAHIFPKNMIKEIFDTYCVILNNLSISNDLWNSNNIVYESLKSPNYLAESFISKRQEVNNTEKDFAKKDKLLHELFFEQAKLNPTQTAIITSDFEMNYGELSNRVKSLSFTLSQINSSEKPNNKLVAVIIEKGWEQVVATLAILSTGFAYLPINPEHPKDRIDYLLSLCEVKIAITQDKWKDKLDLPQEIELISINKNQSDNNTKNINNIHISPTDLAYIIFTSGSTGLPKGVMIDHRGAVNTILDINERFNITSEDKVFAISSLNFDLSVYDFFGALATGATIVIPDPDSSRDPQHWMNLMNKTGVTVWNSVPTLMKMLIEYIKDKPERYIPSLKTVMMSGDWIPLSLPEEIHATNPDIKIYSLGGATEASIWSIYYPIEKVNPEWKSIPYGKPLSNQQMYVLNESLEYCPDYVTGEIYIGGIGLALGYYKDTEKTRNSFISDQLRVNSEQNEEIPLSPFEKGRTNEESELANVENVLSTERVSDRSSSKSLSGGIKGGLYKTGDLGRYLPDGNIEFLGRKDSQVKIQGHRIELGELESVLTQHENIDNVVVMAFSKNPNQLSSSQEKYLVGFIKFKDKALPDKEIIDYMESKLPCYMVPSIFVTMDNFPLNSNGKIDRTVLRIPEKVNLETPKSEINQEYVAKITKMVSDVLNINPVNSANPINPDSDLLAMGANSIDIVKLANLLEQEFGFCPKMGDIFNLKTINKLAEFYQINSSKIVKQENELSTGLILEPAQREVFKNSHKNIRKLNSDLVKLPLSNVQNELFNKYRSSRTFSDKPLSMEKISNLLTGLRHIEQNSYFKAQYASAGSLYPVQLYIHIKENIEDLKEGIYYYNPHEHNLHLLNEKTNISKDIHFFINQDIYEQSKFGIFLVGDLKAIEPIYGNSSTEYCFIEAGSIAQLLRMNAEQNDIGLCQIGQIDFEKVKSAARLDEKHILLHTVLGGAIDKEIENKVWSFLEDNNSDDEEWEEFTI